MRKTKHTPNHDYSTKDMLEDTDLDVVTGGAPKQPMKFPDIKGELTDSYHKDWVTLL